ncbi:3-oxoacyl-[acyl-carrier-protein] synthase 3 [Acaryochloris thomasi RCC1774]|uniref:3-oxoacyl-[acyl-carrier-protein] synthase 3 n=1 Tax=Acaryochloris thomasi RCC1774 TaxID=1764569 RepID=A0A2W1J9S7_9CYAN|nr:beta-ketoacyl-ACP synthase III [Acaryochloris thomasi]PZD70950.1 3-oxoacyl-[acyl-carrier-protein] synthase 3 [Acaryochloris thomasi RCC1774]
MPSAYINEIGKFLPGDAIPNHEIEAHLGQVNGQPSRARKCVLKRNGIQQRYYAIDAQQKTCYSNSQMAAHAVRDGLANAPLMAQEVDLLACGTTLPDLLVPGFASMVHGELPELSPLEIVSTQGVCCSGVAALNYAISQLELGKRKNAISTASEFASRLFKHTKFEAETSIQTGASLPFDTEFLRWMLSDGAGAFILQDRPNPKGLSLRVDWIELISHANAYPVCMSAGSVDGHKSWLDYPSYIEAAQAGAMNLRQNTRLLDQVVKLGVEGWLKLIEMGRVNPQEIDWLLCHYSSHFFKSKIVDLLEKANCMIPEHKWFTNLYTRGNTGCASIYLMLEELFHSGKLQADQKIFCFVPESGRFTTAYMMLTVVQAKPQSLPASPQFSSVNKPESKQQPAPIEVSKSADLLRQLTLTWLEFERQLRSVPLVHRLHNGTFSLEDYQALLRNLRPQVAEGARWIARAASNFTDFQLRSTFIKHAQEEHRDFQMLEQNYVAVGGNPIEILNAQKNIGGEALSAFIFHKASQLDPVDLIGSMMIIEGVGNQLAGQWAKRIQATLNLSTEQVSFLAYHGDNDASHLQKLDALLQADWMTDDIAQRIFKTAQVTARLYRLQLEEIE